MLRRRLQSACLLVALTALSGMHSRPRGAAPQAAREIHLAVIVNDKNLTTNLDLRRLKSLLRLQQEYWPNKKRSRLYLRRGDSPEMSVLLDKVYTREKTFRRLRTYFKKRAFRGDITYEPRIAPRDQDAIHFVQKDVRAFTVVDARVLKQEKYEDIRVLTIDRKKPGDSGYPLAGKREDQTSP